MIMVDEIKVWPGARPPFHRGSCHLTTDGTLDDLHAFAARIGLRREWFQGTTYPHYDLTAAKRDEAMVAGAVFVTARKQAIARRATGTVVDLAAHRKAKTTEAALDELRRVDMVHMLALAADFERQAAPHPEIKTRLVTRLAALLRALAAEQS